MAQIKWEILGIFCNIEIFDFLRDIAMNIYHDHIQIMNSWLCELLKVLIHYFNNFVNIDITSSIFSEYIGITSTTIKD